MLGRVGVNELSLQCREAYGCQLCRRLERESVSCGKRGTLSLRELARALDVSAAFMSDVELGRRQPSDKHVSAIARALGVALEDLKEFDTRPPLQEFRRATQSDPEFGFAFRQGDGQKDKPEGTFGNS